MAYADLIGEALLASPEPAVWHQRARTPELALEYIFTPLLRNANFRAFCVLSTGHETCTKGGSHAINRARRPLLADFESAIIRMD